MKLAGKTAVVTGGAGGIGRETAILLAKEGAKVAVADIMEEGGLQTVMHIRDVGGEAVFFKTDVTSEIEIEQLMDKTMETFGTLDILFNNAGVGNESVRLADMSLQEWQRVIDINLTGVFLGMKYGIPKMLECGGGSVINTSSILGLKGKKLLAPYNASKAGVIMLTKNAALEYGKKKIRVNAIAPGVIDTDIIKDWKQDEKNWPIISGANALGRPGTPDEVAKAALFLASDDASFITASTLVVDGGTLTY
ncbi:glucose 1-dehydrogenase [Bacillus sp. FJAT-42376]|uniref:SDR family NAD(P)-dependent oxidoreductase n=1 Tax=Bacillus sp. FJAT-42376 TaxID=2014076 RepID=UPI000F512486|nr:glucose 1-dehydrogenase [Bacillus sp. FJAT-42376]AZB44012.1 glucose 1-dehydrogenase [Bacillus sp. FJAT-42376]